MNTAMVQLEARVKKIEDDLWHERNLEPAKTALRRGHPRAAFWLTIEAMRRADERRNTKPLNEEAEAPESKA